MEEDPGSLLEKPGQFQPKRGREEPSSKMNDEVPKITDNMTFDEVHKFLFTHLPSSVAADTAKRIRNENIDGSSYNIINFVDLESVIPTVGVRYMLIRFQGKPSPLDYNSGFQISGKSLTSAVSVSLNLE